MTTLDDSAEVAAALDDMERLAELERELERARGALHTAQALITELERVDAAARLRRVLIVSGVTALVTAGVIVAVQHRDRLPFKPAAAAVVDGAVV